MNGIDTDNESLTISMPTYERYCSQIDKEDELIDKRVNWLLTSQSILFAAFGLSGTKIPEIFLPVVSFVGLSSSIAIGISIWAASRSFLWYQKTLIEICHPRNDPEKLLPHLHRVNKHLKLGLGPALTIPFIFFFAWGVILLKILE